MKKASRRLRLAGPALVCASGLALALSAQAARAATACGVGAIEALRVQGVSIVSATTVAAAGAIPGYCDVVGQLNTSGGGAPAGSAGFELRLPANWNKKFLFFGVGGLGGSTYADFSANPADGQAALIKGYATAIADTGHLAGNTDGSWALLGRGRPDEAKLADYYYRATHEVTVAGKVLTRKFFGVTKLDQSYFDGCSNGGRQALVEATQFPSDYDGIIAGDPFLDIRAILAGTRFAKQSLTAATYLPATALPAIDAAVNASCAKRDGVNDGLIQNPAACSFSAYSLICGPNETTGCLTPGQAETLDAYFTAVRDPFGDLIYPGAAVSNLATSATGPLTGGGADVWSTGLVPPTSFTAAEPWGNAGFSPSPVGYQFADHIMQSIVTRDPTHNLRHYPVTATGFVSFAGLTKFDAATAAGDASDPASYQPFLRSGRKLILYHGFSDPALTPYRTINLYKQIAGGSSGLDALQRSARLFMVPGMQHCIGGPGPNVFDTLTALEAWVEQGTPPDSILAAHYINDDPAQAIDRTMPLCAYPTEATYDGSGPVAAASSWSCKPNRRLLVVGANGIQAGADGH